MRGRVTWASQCASEGPLCNFSIFPPIYLFISAIILYLIIIISQWMLPQANFTGCEVVKKRKFFFYFFTRKPSSSFFFLTTRLKQKHSSIYRVNRSHRFLPPITLITSYHANDSYVGDGQFRNLAGVKGSRRSNMANLQIRNM